MLISDGSFQSVVLVDGVYAVVGLVSGYARNSGKAPVEIQNAANVMA
jgi:hypothetical protein